MKTTPILFSMPMVRALLEGSKTQTRRIIKHHPLIDGDFTDRFIKLPENHVADDCKYGVIDDLLWVRETFCPNYFDDGRPGYRADWIVGTDEFCPEPKWVPSIFMPRDASRITLKITNVRVERLNDITVSDAIAEGYYGSVDSVIDPSIEWYKRLWESINGEGSWSLNPWVWALSFEVIKQNIDEYLILCGNIMVPK